MASIKKIVVLTIVFLMMLGTAALAAMPNGVVVIGNKAFDLNYANDPANVAEIQAALVASDGVVYVKTYAGKWVDNLSGELVDASVVPAVTYKDAQGNEAKYEKGDGAQIFEDVSAAEEAVKAYEAAPLTTLDEVAAAEQLEAAANEKVALVKDADAKAALEARIAAQKAKVDAAKAELQAQADADKAVKAYEAASLTTLDEVAAAEQLEAAANEKVALVKDTDAKAALEARIAAQKAKVDAAKAELQAQADADKAVKAYEAAPLDTYNNIMAAAALKQPAVDAVAKVTNADAKAALEARITAQDAKVDAAKALVTDISAVDAYTVKVTFDATPKSLAGQKITLTAADGTSFVAEFENIVDKVANFRVEEGKAITDAVTYTASAGWARFSKDTFVAKIASPYAKSFEKVTTAITAGSTATLYFSAKDQYGESLKLTSVSGITASGTVNGMPLLTSEISATAKSGYVKVTIFKALAENDAVSITLTNKPADKVLGSTSFSYTVVKAVTPVWHIAAITADKTEVYAGDSVTLTADVRDQYNNPVSVVSGDIRWVITKSDGTPVDTKDQGSTYSLTASDAGDYIVDAYVKANGNKATYTVHVGAAKLIALTATSITPATSYNNEDVVFATIAPNAGAVLTPDMLKFNVVASTTGTTVSDITVTAAYKGGTGTDKNDIILTAKTTKAGVYDITPYVGSSFDDSKAIKASTLTVTTTLNPTAASIDAINISTVKVGTPVKAALVIRNKHGEIINEAANITPSALTINVYKDGVSNTGLTVTPLDKDGNVTSSVVTQLKFDATAAGDYTVRISVNGTAVYRDVAVKAEVTQLASIELGSAITDGIIAGDTTPYYIVITAKDNKSDPIIPSITGWTVTVTGDATTPSAVVVYYKKDAEGKITDTGVTQANAEGIALKINAKDCNYSVDKTVTVEVSASGTIKDTLSVKVKAKRALTTLTADPANVTLTLGSTANVLVTAKDQYGAVYDQGSSGTVAYSTSDIVTAGSQSKKTADGALLGYEIPLTAGKVGTTTVTVTYGDKSVTINVTVVAPGAVKTLKFNQDANKDGVLDTPLHDTVIGDTDTYNSITLDLTGVDASGNDVVVKASDFVWATDLPAMISFSTTSGAFTVIPDNIGNTATAEGTVSAYQNGVLVGTIKVKFTSAEPTLASLDFSADDKTKKLTVNGTLDLRTITMVAKDNFGEDASISTGAIKASDITNWTPSDPTVATYAGGKITARAAGTTTFTGFYLGKVVTLNVVVEAAN